MMARRGASGFSLLELLVVITVIAILSALVIPQFGGTFQATLLRSAGRELLGVLHLARSHAVTVQRTTRLRLETASGRYRLEVAGDDGFAPAAVPGAAGRIDERIRIELQRGAGADEPEQTSFWPRRGEEGPAAEEIEFRADGTVDPGEIVLADAAGIRLSVRLHPTTGRVEIRELEREEGP